MRHYVIRFYNLLKEDECTDVISKNFKCDANALRVIATKMQYNRVENILFVHQFPHRFIVVRYR
jgi:hypothetical protein